MRFATQAMVVCALFTASAALAEDLKPLMAVPGKQLMSEDFSGGSVPAAWKGLKGKWSVEDGALKGVRLAADNHPGVVGVDLKNTNAIFQFDFKLGANGQGGSFSLNDSHGHVCRVNITSKGFALLKDGSKTDKSDAGKTLDTCAADFKPGQAYTMMVEVVGDEMVAHIDAQHYAIGSDAKINREKTIVRFTVVGDDLVLDNVKIFEATASPDWTQAKAKLQASHPAPLEAPAPKGKKGAKK